MLGRSAATSHGEFFFFRVWPTGNTSNATGQPVFYTDQYDGQQDQFSRPKFRVAWTQPGLYFIGLNGAWDGSTMKNVVQVGFLYALR